MTWKPDLRTEKHHGPFTVVSETNADRETAHLVTLRGGRQFRVLPEKGLSGQRRSQIVKTACEALARATEALVGDEDALDAAAYLRGHLSDLVWEEIGGEVTIEEWLADQLRQRVATWAGVGGPESHASALLHDLAADGWTVVRKGEE